MSMTDLQRMADHHNSLPGAQITIYPGNSRRQVVDIYRDGECLLQTLEMNTAIHVVASLINAKTQDLRREEEMAKLSEREKIPPPTNTTSRILQEILAHAKETLQANGEMGYTTPDGKYHIYIYADQETHWDNSPADEFYVVEPNKVVNGAHEPMGDTFLTERLDLSELCIGCQWCLEQFAADRAATLTTQDRALALYEENLRVHNDDNDAFYISRNLEYLARCTEPNEEIPLNQLYRLAERLHSDTACFGQPFLNEERLDAVRTLLENGMSNERDACLGNLTPEQTLEFLLTCDDLSFGYAVEETAASNQEKYAPGPASREEQAAFENALNTFRTNLEKPSLDAQISGAAERTSEPLTPPSKTLSQVRQ